MEGGLDIFQILLESGFVVKFVLLLLVLCSILSWAIILKKRNYLNISLLYIRNTFSYAHLRVGQL